MPTTELPNHSQEVLLEIAVQQVQQIRDAVDLHQSLRNANLQPERPDEDQLKQLDSSVKRNTGFIKKLRQLSDDNYRPLLDELLRLNQTRYVAEIVSAIVDAPLRGRDIEAAVQICSLLHQRYDEFGEDLVGALTKSIIAREESKDAAYHRRTRMKLLADLLVTGIYRDFAILVDTLRHVAAVNFQNDWAESQSSLQLLSSFARHVSDELLGISSKNLREFIAQTTPNTGPDDQQEQGAGKALLQQLLADYEGLSMKLQHHPPVPQAIQQQLVRILVDAHSSAAGAFEGYKQSLIRREEQYLRIINSRGDLSEHHASAQEAQRSTAEAMQKSVASLADALDRPAPVLPPAVTQQTAAPPNVDILSGREEDLAGNGCFEDEETRLFYESLPDLRTVVPGVVLASNLGDTRADGGSMMDGDAEAFAIPEAQPNGSLEEEIVDPAAADAEAAEDMPEAITPVESQAGQQMLELIKRLAQTRSAKACDEWCMAFCDVNSKASRNRLVRELADVTANKMALLPFYARITATLSQIFSSISDGVVAGLERSFRYFKARKDNDSRNVERRAVNARYLAELIKFRCMPFGAFFVLLKSLLDDFAQSNVETAATMVEAAGRFLYSLPETCIRMSNMLEVMQRLKIAKNLNIRQAMLVENAYYICRPPDRPAIEKKDRTPLQLYICYLVHDQLAQADEIKQIMQKLRRLAWSENEPYLIRCLLSASVGRYSLAPMLSSLTAGLSRYHPSLRVGVVDSLLEEVRAGLEEPHQGTYQRRMGHIVLLGDMYNYKLVDSRIIFDTLNMFLWFGHNNAEESVILDPPSDFFRTRLICGLLQTCGMFFAKGTAASRLDRFLVFFQRYLLSKEPAPLDVTFELQELFSLLRPSLQRFTTLEEACSAAAALEAQQEGDLEAIEEVPSEEEDGESGSEMGHDGREQGLSQQGASLTGSSDLTQRELDDDTVRLLQPVHAREVEVDEDFEREFAALVPASAASAQEATAQDGLLDGPRSQPAPAVAFRMLTKRAGRDDRSRAVQVPANAAIVQTLRARASAEADERAQIKRLTLAADQRAQLDNGTKPAGLQLTKITQPTRLIDQGEQLNALLRPPRQKARSYLSRG
ncbi:hypothetical protein WJX74_005743 [Apatococcus lobatus]|uniref:MIF4G domain-containing protein n=2 Tax=Apatococcus TaxID=904362 RepID=A0AAW1TK71_9CHLO